MSAYRGRHGPNLSALLGNLNSVDPSYNSENFGSDEIDDLAMFTNADFTHFDMQQPLDDAAFNFDLNGGKSDNVKYEELLAGNEHGQSFNPAPINTPSADVSSFYPTYNTPIQPAPAHGYAPAENHGSPTNSSPGASQPSRRKGESSVPEALSPEDKSRMAAEEDKRRRNTAASARFRVKKKQREQALERTVKEVNDKNSKLEAKVHQLEMENKWLKDLITEKNGMQSKEEMAAAYQKFRKESEERDLEGSEHTTGVGTE